MKCDWEFPSRTVTSESVVKIPELKESQSSALWCGLNGSSLSKFRDCLKLETWARMRWIVKRKKRHEKRYRCFIANSGEPWNLVLPLWGRTAVVVCVLLLKVEQERSLGLTLRWSLVFKGSNRCFKKAMGLARMHWFCSVGNVYLLVSMD